MYEYGIKCSICITWPRSTTLLLSTPVSYSISALPLIINNKEQSTNNNNNGTTLAKEEESVDNCRFIGNNNTSDILNNELNNGFQQYYANSKICNIKENHQYQTKLFHKYQQLCFHQWKLNCNHYNQEFLVNLKTNYYSLIHSLLLLFKLCSFSLLICSISTNSLLKLILLSFFLIDRPFL